MNWNKQVATTLRMPVELHGYVVSAAKRECRTINSYLLSLVMEDKKKNEKE